MEWEMNILNNLCTSRESRVVSAIDVSNLIAPCSVGLTPLSVFAFVLFFVFFAGKRQKG